MKLFIYLKLKILFCKFKMGLKNIKNLIVKFLLYGKINGCIVFLKVKKVIIIVE